MTHPTLRATGKDRVLNVRPDAPDLRDRYYEPALIPLAAAIDNREAATVLDQGKEGACTGFGLAAVINLLKHRRGEQAQVSARMLYEMAQKHDEWPGEDYAGSSCRGAIKGWKNMGVCSDEIWPYNTRTPGTLTIEKAKDARNTILGAYYRLRPDLNDYHAAINETGAIFVSATVHSGWNSPREPAGGDLAEISYSSEITGGHAFAIVGYNQQGFIVQNSWGSRWGTDGFALWHYEDWYQHVSDGWAVRLAVSTPQVFGLTTRSQPDQQAEFLGKAPKRIEIAGHFAHFDDGKLVEKGDDYWSTHDDLKQTMAKVREKALDGSIQHLLIYAHGGLNGPKASANRIAALKDGFLRNSIYPLHMMYDTGLGEELGDVLKRAFRRSEGLFDQWKDKLQDATDKILESIARKPGTALWEEMKRGAAGPFNSAQSDGVKIIRGFLDALDGTGVKLHIVGHSTGAILLGHLLEGNDLVAPASITSCSLMAPACSTEFYKQIYEPRLNASPGKSDIKKLDLYNLNDELEQDDHVGWVYRKSLLYLVSRSFERTKARPLLGMDRYAAKLSHARLRQLVSKGSRTGPTRSTNHGGFDNDLATMNTVLKRINRNADSPFSAKELNY